MKLNIIDPMLLEINKIKDLESISMLEMVQNTENMIVPGFVISYDKGKNLAMFAKEKYFNEFVRKITERYILEKDREVSSSEDNPFNINCGIKIDDKTKRILENGNLLNIQDYYKFYNEKSSYNNSSLYEKEKVESNLKIVLYHLKDILNILGIDIDFFNKINGFRGNYVVESNINQVNKNIVFGYDEISNNTYLYEFCNPVDDSELLIQIEYKLDGIYVNISIPRLNIIGNYSYKIIDNKLIEIKDIHKNLFQIEFEENLLPISEIVPNISNIDSNIDLTYYKLPWSDIYGVNIISNRLSNNEFINEVQTRYITTYNNKFYIKELFSKKYNRLNGRYLDFNEVILDSFNKEIIGVIRDNLGFLIETRFLDSGNSSSFYECNLENKYFYHYIDSLDIKDIEKDKMIEINKDKGILYRSDLLISNKIKKLKRG